MDDEIRIFSQTIRNLHKDFFNSSGKFKGKDCNFTKYL